MSTQNFQAVCVPEGILGEYKHYPVKRCQLPKSSHYPAIDDGLFKSQPCQYIVSSAASDLEQRVSEENRAHDGPWNRRPYRMEDGTWRGDRRLSAEGERCEHNSDCGIAICRVKEPFIFY